MMTWQIILVPIVILLIGIVRQCFILFSVIKQRMFMCKFRNKFIDWCNGEAQDDMLYNWILRKSELVQITLGEGGLIILPPISDSGLLRE